LTNIKIAIFRETYPEDKLTKNDQNSILEALVEGLRRNLIGELPHMKSDKLEGGALIYMCVGQQSGQWLIKAIDNYRLESGVRRKATDARNLPRPVKVALRMMDRVAQIQELFLKWIKNLNPRLHMEHWRVLNKQPEPMVLRLILFIDRDSYTSIKSTGHRIFTGLSHGTVNVLRDTEAQNQQEDIESSKSVSEGEGDDSPTPSVDRCRRDQGTNLNRTEPPNREEIKEKMEIGSSPN
jgi:hypothetical protein